MKKLCWSFWIIMFIVFSSFMAYYVFAKPNDQNDVKFAQKDLNDMMLKVEPCDHNNGALVIENAIQDIGSENTNSAPNNTIDDAERNIATYPKDIERGIGPETYLCEITNFYERVITILSIAIFVILGLVFFFSIRTSKIQAEEMAREFLKGQDFAKEVSSVADKFFNELKNEGDIPAMCAELEELNERVAFLENAITKQEYVSEPEKGENGDNPKT